jgi:UDP-2,3-diacylglucosamine pyrophosphatase LpxH
VIAAAVRQKAQVVVCGHIHHATMRQAGPALYMNCGDWVESRTAIAEHKDGRLELSRWDEVAADLLMPATPVASELQPAA